MNKYYEFSGFDTGGGEPLPAKDDTGGDEKSKEMLQVAMALVRCGWQMACDELLLRCGGKPTWFTDILIDMMDKEKKKQFDWVKLRKEMESMGLEHLYPKTKKDE